MSGSSIPAPADVPDPVSDDTWDPQEFPAHIGGIVEERETFNRKRDGQPFEVLTLGVDGESIRVLCGRTHLAQLVKEHDPQPGDGISVSCFGKESGGNRYLYALRVDKSARLGTRGQPLLDTEPSEAARAARSLHAPLDEEMA
jgi:hypothetical protein